MEKFLSIVTKRRLIIAGFFFFIAGLVSTSYYYRASIQMVINYFASFIGGNVVAGVFIFIGVSTFSVVLSPLSSLPLIPSAIIAWGRFFTFIFIMIGWLVGSLIGYFVGYFAREKLLGRYFPMEKIDYYKNKISPDAQFLLVLIFRLAIPSEITTYTLGIIKYDFKKFALATLISEIPFALLAVFFGEAIYEGNVFALIGIMTFVLIITSFFGLQLNKRFKK